LSKNTSSRVITQSNIIRQERNSNLNCNSSRYSDIPNIKSIYQRTSRKSPDNLKFKHLIFDMLLYLDELQFKFEFRCGRMTFWLSYDPWTRKSPDNLKFKQNTSSRDITQPNIIRPERNSNLRCNSSRYSNISNINSIYQSIDLIFGMWLYLDELHFKFEFCSGRMIFGWVMALELVFFVQIWSCPDFSLKSFDILTLKFEQKYKFKGHSSAKKSFDRNEIRT
jgi:hypothetical protein